MAMAVMAWILAVPLLGVGTGMRTFLPMTVLCWFAYLGYLPLDGTWAFWAATLTAAIVFTILATIELIADKQPWISDRTSAGPLLGRLVFGGLVGAIVAAGLNGSEFEGIVLGVGGALIGAFGGHMVRREIVERSRGKDWPVAVAEDLVAVGFAVIAMGIVTG